MKVKEYLVGRILGLETELKKLQNEKVGAEVDIEHLQDDIIKLKNNIELYQIEREHIKQIITCNIVEALHCPGRYEIDLNSTENDFKTLMAILDIKPEDYIKLEISPCTNCEHAHQPANVYPCCVCVDGDRRSSKEVTPDAETKD